MRPRTQQQGFTLIEIMLYVTIASGFLITLVFFFFTLLEGRVKNNVILNVSNQGTQAMQVMMQQVRNADSITSPSIGTSNNSLVIVDDTVTYTFSVVNDSIEMSSTGGGSVALTNGEVAITDFIVTNYSLADSEGIAQVQFTVSGSSTSARQEFIYTKDFISSASIRPN